MLSAGLIGALLGMAVGYVEYRVILPVVVAKLRAGEAGKGEAELAEFERKLGLFRAIVLCVCVGGGALAGYTLGRLVLG